MYVYGLHSFCTGLGGQQIKNCIAKLIFLTVHMTINAFNLKYVSSLFSFLIIGYNNPCGGDADSFTRMDGNL